MSFTISEPMKIYMIGMIIFTVGSLLGDKQFALYAALFYSVNRLNDLKIREIRNLLGW